MGSVSMGLLSIIRGADKRQRLNDFSKLPRLLTEAGIGAHLCLYAQPEFLQLLHLERRRSERSNRPLCLVLLEGIKMTDEVVRKDAFLRIFHLLRSSVRETDIIGW